MAYLRLEPAIKQVEQTRREGKKLVALSTARTVARSPLRIATNQVATVSGVGASRCSLTRHGHAQYSQAAAFIAKTSYLGDAKHETKHVESKMAYSGVKENKHFEKWRSRSRDTVAQGLAGGLPRVAGESPVRQATYLQLE